MSLSWHVRKNRQGCDGDSFVSHAACAIPEHTRAQRWSLQLHDTLRQPRRTEKLSSQKEKKTAALTSSGSSPRTAIPRSPPR